MQITLNQEEIHTAVEQYVRRQITIADNQAINIDFTAGRGPNGLSATLDIRPAVAAAPSKPVTRSATVETTVAPEVESKDETPEETEEDESDPEPEASADEDDGKADDSSDNGDEDTAPAELAAASSSPRVSIFSSANK